jgi:putative transposase
VQFLRNTCLRKWMEGRGIGDNDLQVSCAQLAQEYPFAARLNSQARQTSADRAWLSIARFYKNCREKQPGKKGAPRFPHDTRSVEYKATGWVLEPDGKHRTCTDGNGSGTMRLIGKKGTIEPAPLKQIKRVRLVKRADGYSVPLAVKTNRTLPQEPPGKQVGIDVGLKAFYTDSDGKTGDHPRYLRKAAAPLKRLHRRVSRKIKRSKNRKQAIKRLAKGSLKVSRQRKDVAVKAARALGKSSDFLAYEDLKSAHLVKHHRLAKSSSAASWGLFLSWVRYYGTRAEVPVVAVSPRFTTQDGVSLWIPGQENPVAADPCVSFLWAGTGPGRERCAEYPGCCPGGSSPAPYRRAGGNGFRFAGTKRFGTNRLYGCVRKSTSQTGWMNEESPGFSRGECQ